MKKFSLALLLLGTMALPATTSAAPIVVSGTTTIALGDVNDLDHHNAYTRRRDFVTIADGQQLVAAQLHIENIANWDSNENRLFMWLFDTAINATTASIVDDAVQGNADDISDYFAGTPTGLVAAGTAGVKLTEASFTTSAVDFDYAFNAGQVSALASYIANGSNFALAFDPDCHYWNDGVSLILTTRPRQVPEPASLSLLALALAGAASARRRARR